MPHSHIATMLKRKLPPAAPLPPAAQTIGCRRWPHEYFQAARRRYGTRFTIYPTAMPPLVALADPAEVRTLLGAPPQTLHPGAGSQITTAFFGPGAFILADEERHRASRSAIMPAFRRACLAAPAHSHMVAEVVAREVKSWPLGEPVATHPYLRSLTLRVMLRTMFGEETQLLAMLHKRILDLPEAAASLVIQQPSLRHLPVWHRTWRRFQRQRRDVYQLTRAILHEHAEARREPGRVVDMLLSARDEHGAPLGQEEILDHLVSLMIAGHETTAAQLSWALQLLAHNRHIQRRLVHELTGGAQSGYLTATVKETLRHRCVFLFAMPRKVVQTIQIGEWTYEPPVHLLAAIHLLHHDPDLFPEPHIFDPQRFLGGGHPAQAWLPWGGGQRRCPGQHLALQEMEIVISTLLASRDLQPAAPEIERARWRNAIVVPGEGGRVVLRDRHLH